MIWAILILALAIMAGLWGYTKFLKPDCGCKQS
jgi:hypothetical protein